jgi:hypothetical protein
MAETKTTIKTKTRGKKPSGSRRRRRGVTRKPTELGATDLALTETTAKLTALADAVRAVGGAVLSMYREPLGGHTRLLTALQIDKVAPTPFQRDISDAHVRRLTVAMDKTKRFLDPIIAVRERTAEAQYWTLNGYHRLTATKELGAKTILALLVPERTVAYQILAFNIEKAHNLREKAIGVRRMYVDLDGLANGASARRTTRSNSKSRRWRRLALPTRSVVACRAVPTTPSYARSTAGCRDTCGTRCRCARSARSICLSSTRPSVRPSMDSSSAA